MNYGEPVYWEVRYQDELKKTMTKGFENFDWYLSFEPSNSLFFLFVCFLSLSFFVSFFL